MNKKWVRSKSGIQHLVKGKVYLCNQAVLHTKDYVRYNRERPTCAKCEVRK